jgi:hypothetical protein
VAVRIAASTSAALETSLAKSTTSPLGVDVLRPATPAASMPTRTSARSV